MACVLQVRLGSVVNFRPPTNNTMTNLLLYLAMMCFIAESNAFRCYVCDSKNDIECLEDLPPDSRLISRDCHNITGAKFCIKTTNLYAGELGTKRFCAANDHGNYCKYVKQPTGDREYRSCVLTCSSENCNHANALVDKQSVFYLAAPLVLFSSVLMTI